jgi:hypothetical protein
MSKLSEVKQDIIDIVEEAGDITFCTAWIRRRLNQIRRENNEFPLRDFVVAAILRSMVDDGVVECVGVDSYILSAPEPELNTPTEVNIHNTYNITFNFIINSTDNSDNSVKTRKGK